MIPVSSLAIFLVKPCSVFCKPTAPDCDGHGDLLDDGAQFGESSVAAVVLAAVVLQGVREVQVAVGAHGNSLILLDELEIWKRTE